ncbi:hypothetical protein HDK64DRAFT_272064 [Phyllosticta capitalensis]
MLRWTSAMVAPFAAFLVTGSSDWSICRACFPLPVLQEAPAGSQVRRGGDQSTRLRAAVPGFVFVTAAPHLSIVTAGWNLPLRRIVGV